MDGKPKLRMSNLQSPWLSKRRNARTACGLKQVEQFGLRQRLLHRWQQAVGQAHPAASANHAAAEGHEDAHGQTRKAAQLAQVQGYDRRALRGNGEQASKKSTAGCDRCFPLDPHDYVVGHSADRHLERRDERTRVTGASEGGGRRGLPVELLRYVGKEHGDSTPNRELLWPLTDAPGTLMAPARTGRTSLALGATHAFVLVFDGMGLSNQRAREASEEDHKRPRMREDAEDPFNLGLALRVGEQFRPRSAEWLEVSLSWSAGQGRRSAETCKAVEQGVAWNLTGKAGRLRRGVTLILVVLFARVASGDG